MFPQASLNQIVNIEKQLNLMLENLATDSAHFTPVEFYRALYDVGFLNRTEMVGEYIVFLKKTTGELPILRIVNDVTYDEEIGINILFPDLEKVLKSNEEFKGFFKIFSNIVFVNPQVYGQEKIQNLEGTKLTYDSGRLYLLEDSNKTELMVISPSDVNRYLQLIRIIYNGDKEVELLHQGRKILQEEYEKQFERENAPK